MASQRKRVQLSQDIIINVVLELAAKSFTEVTFKDLGRSLGVDPTAMYRHFRSKEELFRACLDRLNAMSVDQAKEIRGTWRERLETYSFSVIENYASYPAVGQHATSLDPIGQGENASIEFVLEALVEGGVPQDRIVPLYGAINGLTLSYGAVAAQWNLDRNEKVAPNSGWITELARIDRDAHPILFEYRDELLGRVC